MDKETLKVLEEISAENMFRVMVGRESERQIELWGEQNHNDFVWNNILLEEVGEVAKAILEENDENLLEELAQCVAVIENWVKCIKRRQKE